jgi:hypothetical protein
VAETDVKPGRVRGRLLPLLVLAAVLGGCTDNDRDFTRAAIGTWGSREVAQDDVVVETETTLLPGGRVNWQGELRVPVPSTFYVPRGVNHEVKNGRLVFYFSANGSWFVKDGYLHTRVESSTLPSLMPVGFSAAWKLREVNQKEMIYVSAANGRTRVEYRKE